MHRILAWSAAELQLHPPPSTQHPRPCRTLPATDLQAAVTVLGRLPRRRDISRGDLEAAHLEGANLSYAHLEGAAVEFTHLNEAYLTGASLKQASLLGAYMEGAVLVQAHLEGANLSTAEGLTQQQLDQAILDQRTQLPAGLRPPVSATPPEPAGEQS
jgi:hypothetical protein